MEMEKTSRKSGLLLHISSLPNKYGWGCFSHEAFEFVDFLEKGGFGVWQVLPFSECLYGNSPYSALSSFAINPNFLDLTEFLSENEISEIGLVNGISIEEYNQKKKLALDIVCQKYRGKFDVSKFLKENNYWIIDYAMFKVCKEIENNKPWVEWKDCLKNRSKVAMDNFKLQYKEKIDDEILIQYLLDRQWQKIKNYANSKNIEIFGDMPFYVELDSAEVWANPKNWQLENGKPKLVAGVPPDYFNADGQLWGNPIYNYSSMSKSKYDFFVKRTKRLNTMFDIIRFDHFIAFARYWAVPSTSNTAKDGKWYKGAGVSILKNILEKTKAKFIAEDLGIVTEDVIKLKNKFGLAGIKVIQFAFDGIGDHAYQPHNFEKNCVAYIGTHDNNTFMGLLNEGNWNKINRIKKYLYMPLEEGNDRVIENMIVCLYQSHADLIVLTVQDILHLDKDSRMNIPGIPEGNWTWQLKNNLDYSLCNKFNDLAQTYARKIK